MEKINVVIFVLNENSFEPALSILNFDKINLVAVIIENGDGKAFNLNDRQIPFVSFASMKELLNNGEKFLWLICGFVYNFGNLWKTKKFLINSGVPEDNIVNFHMQIAYEYFANLRYIEERGADFFATGISYTEVGLNLNFIPMNRVGGGA